MRVGFTKGSFAAGENLAMGSGGAATVRETMSNWLESDLHRSVLLTPRFRRIGIGTAQGTYRGYEGVRFWVAHFGSSR